MDLAKVFAPRTFVALALGVLLAVLAFSQAAASIGLPLAPFRPLGPGFFTMRGIEANTAKGLVGPGPAASPSRVAAIGRQALAYDPMDTLALWLVGQSLDHRKQPAAALAAMTQAERISRRDAAVQLWLGLDDLKKRQIAPALHHFDLMIRTNTDAANLVTPVLAKVIVSPQGRQQMAPYFTASNPWFVPLLWASASSLPTASPLAQLLVEKADPAPDAEGARAIYAYLLKRLLAEKSYDLALRLYPKLPGADRAALGTLNPATRGKVNNGYQPFVWGFSDSGSQGGDIVVVDGGNSALELYGAPGTVGTAASKLIVPGANRTFRWRIVQRTSNPEASATWVATCLLGPSAGAKVESANLLADSVPLGKPLAVSIPANCNLMRFDLNVAGGIGRDPADLIVAPEGLGTAAG